MLDEIHSTAKKIIRYFLDRDILLSLVIVALLVTLTVLAGAYNNKVVPLSHDPLARYLLEPSNPLKIMANWDGLNYLHIAVKGYSNISLANFFPLYPLMIRLFHQVISSPLISALLVSWFSLVGAVYFYLKILKKQFNLKNNSSALYGLAFFLLFPTGVFLIATYSESLLAFLTLGAIYFALSKKAYISSAFCLLCTMTHLGGPFVVILVALILAENREKLYKIAINCLAGIAGLASYMIFLSMRFHKPLAFISSQKSHGWLHYSFSYFFGSVDVINIIMLILVILSIIYWWSKKSSFALYSFLFLLIPIFGGQFGGFNRYILMDFPIQFMAFDYLRNRRSLYTVAIILTVIGWSYFVLQYAGGYVGG